MVDSQTLLLPGVVAVVVGLSVIYLIYRLFVSSSPTPSKSGSAKTDKSKKKKPAVPKKPQSSVSAATDDHHTQPTPPHQKKQKKLEKKAPSAEEEEEHHGSSSSSSSERETNGGTPTPKKKKRVKKVPSIENLSDFLPIDITKDKEERAEDATKPKLTVKAKIAAAQEEPLAEGWEIVGLKKNQKKEEKKKERELEIAKERAELEEKKRTAEESKMKEGKREGGKGMRGERREGRDNKGPRGNRPPGDRRNKKGKAEDKTTNLSQVSEKTKRREEIKINGILFSKFRDDEEGEEVWELLSDIIELGASDSDDIAPLRTAHLELRYYSHAKEAASPSPKKHASSSAENHGESWTPAAGELAKYNYTQGKIEDVDKEKDEGPSEIHTPPTWELGEEQAADEKTSELIEAYIKALGHPFTSNLAQAKLSVKGKPQRFLIKTDENSLRARLIKLLSSGVSLEPAVCRSQSEAAEFVEKLLGFLGGPFECYTNELQSLDGTYQKGAKFWRKGFGDAGFFIITASKVVMIWFIGYD